MTEESTRTQSGQAPANPAGGEGGQAFTREQVDALFINAAREGDADLLARFLEAGMDPNLRMEKGYTPLILAAYNGHGDAVRVLLDRGADPNLKDEKGSTALSGVAFKGDVALVNMLLAAGAEVDAVNAVGRTPLMFAVMFGRDDVARVLLGARANVLLRDGEGLNALDLAQRQGNGALLQDLKKAVGVSA
ncbi:ankyrin repeat domain-containing protein [Acetobacter sp.]|uniref:ankyrin repeat domain-containing protein n=1 Tax=Acetobacter sp. TaxID=440 RepID=UPI0039EA3BB6